MSTPAVGASIYSPQGIPSVVDANEQVYVNTTLSAAVAIGATSFSVASAASIAVGQLLQITTVSSGAELVQVTGIAGTTISCYPAFGKTHASGDLVIAQAARQINTVGDPSTPGNQQNVLSNGAAVVALARARTILTSTSPTALTNIRSAPCILRRIINTGAALTVYPRFYDESNTSGAQSDCIWGDGSTITLNGGQSLELDVWLINGLTYSLSAALPATANIVVVTT